MTANNLKKSVFLFIIIIFGSNVLSGQVRTFGSAELQLISNEQNKGEYIVLPNPKGEFEKFEMLSSSIADSEYERKFPEIKSFKIFSENTGSFGRLLLTPNGIYAFIFDGEQYYGIEKNNSGRYVLSDNTDLGTDFKMDCGTIDSGTENIPMRSQESHFRSTENLRIFRIAIASSGEFTNGVYGQGSVATVQAVIASRLMALNVMYENEMSIHFELIGNNEVLTYTHSGLDGFDPDDRTASAHDVIDNKIGSANYDIGHVFYEIPDGGSSGSGVAYLQALCSDWIKAGGWSGVGPTISFMGFMGIFAHEIGHQCSAHHSYYGTDDFCSARSPGNGYEPGSGNSMMSYEGSCLSHNITPESSTLFMHLHSLLEMDAYISTLSCGTSTPTGNTAPVVTAPEDKILPMATPFELEGSATDNEDEVLYYDWEQYDTDNLDLEFPNGHPDNAQYSYTAPLFRAYDPSPTGNFRSFPKLSDILNNEHTIGEILSRRNRDIHMRLVARDKHAGVNAGNAQTGGAFAYDETVLTITTDAGPFFVSSQNSAETWVANGINTVDITWNVANTDLAPVSCTMVDILFSVDGGKSFPYLLSENTANDGTETLLIPNLRTYKGRIKIKASNNYFFDINNRNIQISTSCLADGANFSADTTIVELVGSPALNLDLTPDYGLRILKFEGSLSTEDIDSYLAQNSSGSCLSYGGNTNVCDIYTFYVEGEGNYTFGKSAGDFGVLINIYEEEFFPESPCTNWLASSAQNSFIYPQVTVNNLKPSIKYKLVVCGWNANQPVLPSDYTYIPISGGSVFDDIPDPGKDYSYTYVIVDNETGLIVNVDPEADLSNFPAGSYSVHGMSYLTTHLPNPAQYNGEAFSKLQHDLLIYVFCGRLSYNMKTVIVEGLPCDILETGLVVNDCDDNDTPMDPDDDTFSISLNPTGIDVSDTYSISGDLSIANLNFGEVHLIDALPANGSLLNLRITDDINGCFLNFEVQAPEYCSRTCVFTDAQLLIAGCSDDYAVTIDPIGINFTGSYSISGDFTLNNLSFQTLQTIGSNLNAADGDLSITLFDDNHSCSIDLQIVPPKTKAEISDYTAIASSCTNNTGSVDIVVTGGQPPYQFDIGNGFQNETLFENLGADNYTITIMDALGCQTENTVTVPSENGPSVELGNDLSICAGEITTLDAGNEGVSYEWTLNGVSIPDEIGSNLEVTLSGIYGVVVTNAAQCSSSDFVQVTVNPLPEPDLGQDITACIGEEVTLDAGSDGVTYLWQLDGSDLPQSTASITISTPGTYAVTVTNSYDCSESDEIIIDFIPGPVVDLGNDILACDGDLIELDPVENDQGYSYFWFKDDVQFSVSKKVVVTESGTYRVDVSNGACTASQSIEVQFNSYPSVSIASSQYAFCAGESKNIIANAGSGPIIWYKDGILIPGEESTTLAVTEAGTYRIEISNGPCISYAETLVIVYAIPEPDLGTDFSLCPGEMIDLNAGDFAGFDWSDGSTNATITLLNNNNASVSTSELFSITVTDSNGCKNSDELMVTYLPVLVAMIDSDSESICPGESVELRGTGGVYYSWTAPDNSLSANDVSAPIATPVDTTVYTLIVSDDCPDNTDTQQITIIVFPESTVSAGMDTCILKGQSILLNATGGEKYHWTDPGDYLSNAFISNPIASPNQSTVFSVAVEDEYGCIYSDDVEICIITDPDLIIPATSIISPNGDGKNDELYFRGLESFDDNFLIIYSKWGEEMFAAKDYQITGPLWGGTKNGIALPAGIYFYVLNFGEYTIKSSLTIVR